MTVALLKAEMRYPFVPWRELFPRIQWKIGQHVVCIGGTDSGKSTLMGVMLRTRPTDHRVVVPVSKGFDRTLTGPLFRGYEHYHRWPPRRKHMRVILWPKNGSTIKETRRLKAELFSEMFNDVLLRRGHTTIAVDEEHYVAEALGLYDEITDMLEQGRSFDISQWNNSQRPARIPLATYTNSLHGFFFLTQEDYDVKRLGQMRNKHTDAKGLIWNIERLDHHEFVYIDKIGKLPPVRSVVER